MEILINSKENKKSTSSLFDYGDQVAMRCGNKGYQFGLFKDSLHNFYDQMSSSDAKKQLKLQVAWLHGDETLVPLNKLVLVDRGVQKGDVVTRFDPKNDNLIQVGYVMDIKFKVHLKILDNTKTQKKYIYNVDSKKLELIQKWYGFSGEVVYGYWRGKKLDSTFQVTLIFPDGAQCKVDMDDLDSFEHVGHKMHNENFNDDVYPGQQLTGILSDLNRAKWIKTTSLHSHKTANKMDCFDRVTVTVSKISVDTLDIDWMYYDNYRVARGISMKKAPDASFSRKSIEKLTALEAEYGNAFLQIGDRYMYKISQEDEIHSIEPGKMFDVKSAHIKKTLAKNDSINTPMTRSKSFQMNSGTDQKKNQKITEDKVPVQVEFMTSWVKVMWQDGTVEDDIRSVDLLPTGPDTEDYVFPGHYVIPSNNDSKQIDYGVVLSANNREKTCIVNWFKIDRDENRLLLVEEKSEMSIYSIKINKKFQFDLDQRVISLKAMDENNIPPKKKFGLIKEMDPKGFLVVKWHDGSISNCLPIEVAKANCTNIANFPSFYGDEDLDEEELLDDNDSFEEGITYDSLKTVDKKKLEMSASSDSDISAIICNISKTSPQSSFQMSNFQLGILEKFEHFQYVAEVHSSHQFFWTLPLRSGSGVSKSFYTAVNKDIKILKTSLPRGIFVKGFEDRLDLYSAMIEGPCGTPYEDALFFFDIWIPPNYPNLPPRVHYHSFCSDRLNPNLYEDGKVCLSLLGTWSGEGTELWSPKSNLYQVLLSIQALILVPQPYFNEPGFELQRGSVIGEKESRAYNEGAVLKTLKSMIMQCERAPIVFKDEVNTYVSTHSLKMNARLKYWIQISLSEKEKQNKEDNIKANINNDIEVDLEDKKLTITDKIISSSKCLETPSTSVEQGLSSLNGRSEGTKRKTESNSNISEKKMKMKSNDLPCTSSNLPDSDLIKDQNSTTELIETETIEDRKPKFPLLPMSRGCCLCLQDQLEVYRKSILHLEEKKG